MTQLASNERLSGHDGRRGGARGRLLAGMSHPDSPMRTNAALNVAEAAAILMAAASARAKPPPDAGPLTAAITGCRRLRSFGTSAAIRCWRCIRDWGETLGVPGRCVG